MAASIGPGMSAVLCKFIMSTGAKARQVPSPAKRSSRSADRVCGEPSPPPWCCLPAAGILPLRQIQRCRAARRPPPRPAEQLEQALAERRRADALAAEKRQLEAQARQRADAGADAKRRADVEPENARQARQKAERELVQLKADIEARRRAEGGHDDQAAVIAQRATEEAAQRKAEAEAASLREAEEAAAK